MRRKLHGPLIVLLFAAAQALGAAAAQTASVTISPSPVATAPGQSVQLTAQISGAAPPYRLMWSLRGPRVPGVNWGRLTNTGLYTTPRLAPPGQVHVVATLYGRFGQPIAAASVPVRLMGAAVIPTTRARRWPRRGCSRRSWSRVARASGRLGWRPRGISPLCAERG